MGAGRLRRRRVEGGAQRVASRGVGGRREAQRPESPRSRGAEGEHVSKRTFGMVVIALLVAPLLAVWHAYALTILWGWFVVPLGMAPIAKAHAYGISCVVTLLT